MWAALKKINSTPVSLSTLENVKLQFFDLKGKSLNTEGNKASSIKQGMHITMYLYISMSVAI